MTLDTVCNIFSHIIIQIHVISHQGVPADVPDLEAMRDAMDEAIGLVRISEVEAVAKNIANEVDVANARQVAEEIADRLQQLNAPQQSYKT